MAMTAAFRTGWPSPLEREDQLYSVEVAVVVAGLEL